MTILFIFLFLIDSKQAMSPKSFEALALYSSLLEVELLSPSILHLSQNTILDIDSIKLLDTILLPLLFKCNFEPLRCLMVIVLSWMIRLKLYFLHSSFKLLFTSAAFSLYWSSLIVMFDIDTLQVSVFKFFAS